MWSHLRTRRLFLPFSFITVQRFFLENLRAILSSKAVNRVQSHWKWGGFCPPLVFDQDMPPHLTFKAPEALKVALLTEFLLWYNGLRILSYHGCGTDHSCGLDSIPGPGTSICQGYSQKKKKKKKGCTPHLAYSSRRQAHISNRCSAMAPPPIPRGWGAVCTELASTRVTPRKMRMAHHLQESLLVVCYKNVQTHRTRKRIITTSPSPTPACFRDTTIGHILPFKVSYR